MKASWAERLNLICWKIWGGAVFKFSSLIGMFGSRPEIAVIIYLERNEVVKNIIFGRIKKYSVIWPRFFDVSNIFHLNYHMEVFDRNQNGD